MKINLTEDDEHVIQGEPVDGTVDLAKELAEKIKSMCYKIDSILYSDINMEEIPKRLNANAPRGRISANLSTQDNYLIKWTITLNYGDTVVDKFVIPKDIIALGARFLIERIYKQFPELDSYPEELVNSYRVRFEELDIFTTDGYLPFKRFYEDTDIEQKMLVELPLMEYIDAVQAHAEEMYTLPYEVVFSEGFEQEYFNSLAKARKLIRAYKSGTFKGHKYDFKYARPTIGLDSKPFNHETKIMNPNFYLSIAFDGLILDGVDVSNEIIPSWNLKPDTVLNEVNAYHLDLKKSLKEKFKAYKVLINSA